MVLLGPNGVVKLHYFQCAIGEQNVIVENFINNKSIDQIPIHLRSKKD